MNDEDRNPTSDEIAADESPARVAEAAPGESDVEQTVDPTQDDAAQDETAGEAPVESPEAAAESSEPGGDDADSADAGAEDAETGSAEQADSADAAAEQAAAEPDAEEADDGGDAASSAGEGGEPAEQMNWYILKVQSNRESSISDALRRRVAVAGLDEYFGEVIVPTEIVTEFKGGKKRVVKRKLYPGYIVAQMVINDDTWFLVRETPGIGDFTGAGGKPTPMQQHEVDRIVRKEEEEDEKAPTLKIPFNVGEKVKINEGTFENFEGEVSSIDEASGHVTVMINIFGRSTPVELEYWQVEAL